MATTIPVRVGDVELLVETTQVAGSEPTSRLSDAAEGVADAFSRAQEAIVEVAGSTAKTIGEAKRRGVCPDRVDIEFGLKVSARGNLLIAGVSGDAMLRVMLTYESTPPNGNSQPAG